MEAGEPADIASSLAELERALRELEQELHPPDEPATGAPRRDLPVEDLVRFREQLVRSTQQLVAEYTRLLERLGGSSAPPPAAVGRAGGLDATVLTGDVTIDAGPFADEEMLSAFGDAVGRIEGVEMVRREDIGGRALIEVRLERPLPLAASLRVSSPVGFQVVEAGGGRLVLAVAS